MARTPNRSKPAQITVTLPAQTHAYLLKLASVGALGSHEGNVATYLLVSAVEALMAQRRAEIILVKDFDGEDQSSEQQHD